MSIFLCIDLKSFYASVECVERGLDSMKTKLVVADPSRGGGAICLAVSPALKALGVKNRCRIFDIPKSIDYICAMPRMKKYMEKSAEIYSIYLKYASSEDIVVYSIDECFIDITSYLTLYKMDSYEIAKMIIDDVYKTTGICATCGIGTNLYLAKIALDITAKHAKDFIGYLDEDLFKKELWFHKPITDFWGISYGTQNRLMKYGIEDMYEITQIDEKILYEEFGINAELLIDHAYGRESCTIEDIHKYKPKSNSLSSSQILFRDYNYNDAFIVLKEMVDNMCLELVDRGIACQIVSLGIGYSKDVRSTSGGSVKISCTNSYKEISCAFNDLYIKTTDKAKPIRRIGIGFAGLVPEEFREVNLFTDVDGLKKEHDLQITIADLKKKYGKNSILKGMNYLNVSTMKQRNKLIGGHNSGENE